VLAIELVSSGRLGTHPASLFAVADGIGGYVGGQAASRAALRILAQEATADAAAADRHKNDIRTVGDGRSLMASWVRDANSWMFSQAKDDRLGMGTTLVSALLSGETAYVANVGDSRCYVFDGSRLRQVTRDHSLVAGLVAAGDITPEEATKHPQRNIVTRYIGAAANVEADIFLERLRPGVTLLLCSDGLWETVPDRDTARILSGGSGPQIAANQLVEAARKAGAPDNVSAVVVNVLK
jgi:serine/threonine protein phosphatase PrpC